MKKLTVFLLILLLLLCGCSVSSHNIKENFMIGYSTSIIFYYSS